jgi:type II secretory pathway component PulF
MLRWTLNIFFAIVIAILGCLLLYALLGGTLPVEVPVVLLLFAALLAVAAWASGLTKLGGYKNREDSVLILTYLEQAVRLNLPLPRMLLAAEMSERRGVSYKIHQLRSYLDSGDSITDSLKRAVPGTPRRTLGLLAAAEGIGRIGGELNRLVRDAHRPRDRSLAERSFLTSYPFGMVVVIVFVLAILTTFVMPKYTRILHDFRMPMPPLTQAVLNVLHVFGDNGWLQLAILLTAALAIIQRVRLSIGNRMPPIWYPSSRHYADVCHMIAGALEAGMPLDGAIRTARELAIPGYLRRKLQRWADGIERGIPTADAATAAGMPRLIVGLTANASTDAAAEAFVFLSRYYAAKFSRWMMLVQAAAVPAMVFFFGLIVAIVALAMFLPMVEMIDRLSGFHGGAL